MERGGEMDKDGGGRSGGSFKVTCEERATGKDVTLGVQREHGHAGAVIATITIISLVLRFVLLTLCFAPASLHSVPEIAQSFKLCMLFERDKLQQDDSLPSQ